MKFKTQYDIFPVDTEKNDQTIVTVPDQSLTPGEILVRFAQGLGSSIRQKEPIFDQNPDIKGMTLEEIQYERQELDKRITDLEENLQYLNKKHRDEKTLKIANEKLAQKTRKMDDKSIKQKNNMSDETED